MTYDLEEVYGHLIKELGSAYSGALRVRRNVLSDDFYSEEEVSDLGFVVGANGTVKEIAILTPSGLLQDMSESTGIPLPRDLVSRIAKFIPEVEIIGGRSSGVVADY